MSTRNNLVLLGVLVLFVLAGLMVFPIAQFGPFGQPIRLGLDLQGGTRIVYKADLSTVTAAEQATALADAMSVLENRINPLGVSETSVRKLGTDEILVEIPGRSLSDTEKQSLGNVALLEFAELVTDNGTYKWENSRGKWKPATAILAGVETELTSKFFKSNSFVDRDPTTGNILLRFEWDKDGSVLSQDITTRLQGQPLGIFEGDSALLGDNGQPIAPIVNDVITTSGEITGLSLREATQLSKQLNAGRLPVQLHRTGDEKTVEPWLGGDFVSRSVKAGLLGFGIIMLFMVIYYRVSGLVATLALVYYSVLTLAIFKLFNSTLTLAGIGGFVLSIGMAVDANVLIFERMKEEMWDGKTLGAAIEAGFKRAFSAILDSNATTVLAGAVLFWLGSSSFVASDMAKGFAVTLVIGVLVSMFTAITVTRTFLRPFVRTGLAGNLSLFAPNQRKKDV